jgi:aryl-alcohol dehydrogenase-like predicted oxidoreductase
MKTRRLGTTDLEISEVGLGTWALGGVYYGPVDDEEAVKAVRTYLDAGGNHVDTAYSYHKAEPLAGKAIQGYDRDKLILASKTYCSNSYESTKKNLRDHVTLSLRDLGADYLDLYYLHGPPHDPDEMHRVLDEYLKLKDEGLIRYIAASIPGPDVTDAKVALAHQYIASGKVNALQIAYSPLRQKARQFFAAAAEAGVGVIARQVIESGFLTGKYKPGDRFTWPDHRTRWLDDHRDEILKTVQEDFVSLPLPDGYSSPAQVAVKYTLDAPEVAGVVLGANKASQVARNVVIDDLPPLPDELVRQIDELYEDRNDFFNPTGELEHVPSPRS